MITKKRMLAVAVSILALGTALTGAVWGEELYREYYHGVTIDPFKGVEGDADSSNTIRYWRTEADLERNKAWIEDKEHSWKLNYKYMDLDRIDLHPGHLAVDEGKAMVDKFSKRDPAFLDCLGDGSSDLKGKAATYPQYDPALGRIMTVESRIEHCAKSVLNEDLKLGTQPNNTVSVYFKSLSAGMPLRVNISIPQVMEAFRRGEKLYNTKVGQLNFACASCHSPGSIMGHKLRGEVPTSSFGDMAHYPTYRTPVSMLESTHERFMRCQAQMRAVPAKPGDPVYFDLEVFMTVLSNGYPVSVPSAR